MTKPIILSAAILAAMLESAPANPDMNLGTIMPIGDSITKGAPAGAFRDPLFSMLKDGGYSFQFVGTLTENPPPALTAAGQDHHQGHSGMGMSWIDEHLREFFAANQADRILLAIGTNDIGDNVHPNVAGSFKMARAWYTALTNQQPTLAPPPERLPLWTDQAPIGEGKTAAENAFITVHRPARPNGAAVVICPGGGYGGLVTDPEGHGIAKWLNSHGLTGVVLEYRLPGGRQSVPLLDAQRAIRTVRSRAREWGCDPARIGIMGFSAGGHLAATAATHFDAGDARAKDPIQRLTCRPDFAILIYPVITMGQATHGGSKQNLLGPNPAPGSVELFSNEKQVTERTPPVFLAHAQDDTLVTPNNSQLFHDALQAHKVPSEYLKLPSGGHGLNGYHGPMWDAWQSRSLQWLAARKIIPQEAAPKDK